MKIHSPTSLPAHVNRFRVTTKPDRQLGFCAAPLKRPGRSRTARQAGRAPAARRELGTSDRHWRKNAPASNRTEMEVANKRREPKSKFIQPISADEFELKLPEQEFFDSQLLRR